MLLEIPGRTSSTTTASAATLKVRTGDVSQCFGYGRLYLLRDGGVVILFRITRFFLAGLPESSGLLEFLFLWLRSCCSVVSICWVISLSVIFNLHCSSGMVAWNSLVMDWNSVLIVSLMSFNIFWWHSEWWLMRIAVSWHPHSIRQPFQCLVKVTGG